jgi:hypothetical protein
MEEVDEMSRWPASIPISCSLRLNMDGLLERIWDMMALVGDRARARLAGTRQGCGRPAASVRGGGRCGEAL